MIPICIKLFFLCPSTTPQILCTKKLVYLCIGVFWVVGLCEVFFFCVCYKVFMRSKGRRCTGYRGTRNFGTEKLNSNNWYLDLMCTFWLLNLFCQLSLYSSHFRICVDALFVVGHVDLAGLMLYFSEIEEVKVCIPSTCCNAAPFLFLFLKPFKILLKIVKLHKTQLFFNHHDLKLVKIWFLLFSSLGSVFILYTGLEVFQLGAAFAT